MRISVLELNELTLNALTSVGVHQDDARVCRDSLVSATLRGHASHGVLRVPRYITAIKNGLMRPSVKLNIKLAIPGVSLIDANMGIGSPSYFAAIDKHLGSNQRIENPISLLLLSNCGHFGRLFDYARYVSSKFGLISIIFANVRGSDIVSGGNSKKRISSTTPMCIGMPIDNLSPLILDFSTAQVAEGKVLVALKKGENLAEKSLMLPGGEFTDDPRALYGKSASSPAPSALMGDASIIPSGGLKGAFLNLFIEILAGGLTGGGVARTSGIKRTIANNSVHIFIDPKLIATTDASFNQEVIDYLSYYLSLNPDQSLADFPGHHGDAIEYQSRKDGVEITDELYQYLRSVAPK